MSKDKPTAKERRIVNDVIGEVQDVVTSHFAHYLAHHLDRQEDVQPVTAFYASLMGVFNQLVKPDEDLDLPEGMPAELADFLKWAKAESEKPKDE